MTKPKPQDQLQKRAKIFIPRGIYFNCKSRGEIWCDRGRNCRRIRYWNNALERWKEKYPEFRGALNVGQYASRPPDEAGGAIQSSAKRPEESRIAKNQFAFQRQMNGG